MKPISSPAATKVRRRPTSAADERAALLPAPGTEAHLPTARAWASQVCAKTPLPGFARMRIGIRPGAHHRNRLTRPRLDAWDTEGQCPSVSHANFTHLSRSDLVGRGRDAHRSVDRQRNSPGHTANGAECQLNVRECRRMWLKERRRRDLNPRSPCEDSTLAGWCTRPDYATSPGIRPRSADAPSNHNRDRHRFLHRAAPAPAHRVHGALGLSPSDRRPPARTCEGRGQLGTHTRASGCRNPAAAPSTGTTSAAGCR